MFMCGLERSNFSFAISIALSWQIRHRTFVSSRQESLSNPVRLTSAHRLSEGESRSKPERELPLATLRTLLLQHSPASIASPAPPNSLIDPYLEEPQSRHKSHHRR